MTLSKQSPISEKITTSTGNPLIVSLFEMLSIPRSFLRINKTISNHHILAAPSVVHQSPGRKKRKEKQIRVENRGATCPTRSTCNDKAIPFSTLITHLHTDQVRYSPGLPSCHSHSIKGKNTHSAHSFQVGAPNSRQETRRCLSLSPTDKWTRAVFKQHNVAMNFGPLVGLTIFTIKKNLQT